MWICFFKQHQRHSTKTPKYLLSLEEQQGCLQMVESTAIIHEYCVKHRIPVRHRIYLNIANMAISHILGYKKREPYPIETQFPSRGNRSWIRGGWLSLKGRGTKTHCGVEILKLAAGFYIYGGRDGSYSKRHWHRFRFHCQLPREACPIFFSGT